jgi:glutamyl-tRNA synthetase
MNEVGTLSIRTRMAPSPTGEYHIGHIRTLLYNWALAKKAKGRFVIRIEDTDRERYVEGAVERILDVISDYGFDWDEGPRVGGGLGPYIQSQRLDIYHSHAQVLIEKGFAYYCFCSEERLNDMREEQKSRGVVSTKYDGLCLKLGREETEKKLKEKEPYVIRMRVPQGKILKFTDLILGDISFSTDDIDDQVLIKSDGFPTYHFAVVVDDHLMKITHVMRGNDWVSSTPKHVLLYQAFGWKPHYYAHIPNLKELGAGKKLSKRFGAISAREFLDEGYLPEAVLNFLMFLGWNPGTDREFYTLGEFVKDFSIEKIHKTDLISFDRNKLLWMNGEYIKRLSDKDFAERVKSFAPKNASLKDLEKIAPLVKSRIKKLTEFETLGSPLFEDPGEPAAELIQKINRDHLEKVCAELEKIPSGNWSDKLDEVLMDTLKKNKYSTGEFFMSLRIAVFASNATPPFNDSVKFIGKDKTLARIKRLLR